MLVSKAGWAFLRLRYFQYKGTERWRRGGLGAMMGLQVPSEDPSLTWAAAPSPPPGLTHQSGSPMCPCAACFCNYGQVHRAPAGRNYFNEILVTTCFALIYYFDFSPLSLLWENIPLGQ